ncbi:DUF2017 family protein [Crossiella sp. CA-258035]|uniref:DUF2017 family protein n=1 Tax=Crossiella sp. CA-258035 TaxID=2981138 RepID=UPI0024BCE22C|nr:DUF2017 family protein [Crossiella sp. CA-258035]WHT22928.1 DUF2017 family protein [Crossiella sp. CA-258035]
MIRWGRAGGRFVGITQPQRIRWLHARLILLRELVDRRTAEYSTDYPLGDRLGLPMPCAPPADPAMATLLRTGLLDPDEPPEIQLWHEPEFLAWLQDGITATLATLEDQYGLITVAVDPDAVRQWSSVLLNLRIAYAAARTPELLTAGELPDPSDDRRLAYAHAAWLWDAVNTLHAFAVS